MRGEDALQALAVALNLAPGLLEYAVVQGASLWYPGASDEISLEAYLPIGVLLNGNSWS